jgi:uncharacterized membrane protein
LTGLWKVVLYVHVLAMAFFVGGQIFLGLAVVPVERANPDRGRMLAIARRFGYGSAIALALLIATGVAMASHFGIWNSSTLQLKVLLVGALVLLTVVHLRFSRAHILQGAILLVTLVIVWLGLDLAT